MFDLIDGLPWHPLVVHAVVVLLPLAVLGTILIAVVPRWRRPYGPLVVAAAAVATALVPVATSSGEALEKHVGDPGEHAELGDQLIWFAVPLLVLTLALVVLERRSGAGARRGLVAGVAVLAVIASLATAVQVYRVGESGARAAWADRVSSSAGR
ncbi:hypothetical protein ASD11_17410 [Aeromicrobium sp. Root495]|uniref:DUF2231 domain-containing protein n=1 Tax=Aeromicrobium sp. Root495 TaxID=1736550 RepID=UPI0006FFB200|nr:DUF2231 domain-containing protein [Aeromicrobium sp. Root495]KQY55322.1 hypothetical protein ASD11_17410 [Aeromicrobium sp. Root495]